MNVPPGDLSIFSHDYAVLKINPPHISENYAPLNQFPVFPIVTKRGDSGLVAGHPITVNGNYVHPTLHFETKEELSGLRVINVDNSNHYGLINHYMDATGGNSGGPFFWAENNASLALATGVISFGVPLNNVYHNFAAPIDNRSTSNIFTWMQANAPNINITINSPQDLSTIDWATITNTTFSASLEGLAISIEKSKAESDLIWNSNVAGEFFRGANVTALEARSKLRPGIHDISVFINESGYRGLERVLIEITGPSGNFTHHLNYCILDLSVSSVSCNVNISWSTKNTNDALVWNESDDVLLHKANNMSNFPVSVNVNPKTFTLYASNEKLLDLDTVQLSAKTPTGTLSSPSPQCSLQPGPQFNANGDLINDPKATPSACGTELKWNNVQWASPGIFYKPVGSGSWQLLYQIPCDLDGEVCSGSIHTDDFQPGLIAASGSGYEFKLLQFTDPGSGQLSAPFSVTAHRFADAYEFDDGWFEVPISGNQQEVKTRMLAWGGMISNQLEVGQSQQGHNFHRPAAYDDGIDVDAFDIQSPVPVLGDENAQIEFIVSNMASSLDVTFEIQCVGLKDFRAGPNDDIEPISGVWEIPFNQIASNTRSGNVRKMTFNYFKRHTGYVDEQFIDLPACTKNRVVVKRTSGQPSENLSYDVSVNLVGGNSNTPELESAGEMNTTTYKVELIGENFGVNTASNIRVSVRENINGSQPFAVYSSDFFHNIGTHVSSHAHAGKDFIRFPIIKTSRQNIFRNNGLCFKVLSDTLTSNEVCRQIPARTTPPGFAGATVQSYHENGVNQDIDSNAFVTKTNGSMLKLWGNSWKKIPMNYTVTPNTELEIDFKSTHGEVEFAGVGFILQGQTEMADSTFWQFHGTQNWGIQAQHNYSGTAYKTYSIKIGEQFTGQISHMVFVADNDAQSKAQNVVFVSPSVYESNSNMKFMGQDVLSISPGSHDVDVDEYSVNAAGDTLNLTGNTWKAISYPYNVTANTVLEFQFRSTGQEAEINGIGFSSSLSVPATNRGWQVHGTQDWAEGITHANYSGNGWVTYTIPIGQTFTGNINYMVFVGDDDGTRVNQNVEYRNPVLREETPVQLFLGKEVLSISPGSHDVDVDEYSVNAAGDTLNLTGNTWKAISYPYNVTANTVLEFQFRSTGQEAEINGIGFSSSLSVPATNRGWQVHGTQDWAEGITHANYSGNGWVTYTIPIGQTFTGNINYMVFVGDDDGTRVNQNVEYRNPVLREETPVQLFLGKEVLSISPGSHDVDVDEYSVNAAGDTLNLTGNTWKAISYPYNVTANTVLEFQFRSTGQEAEINGIGFSSSLSVPATNRGWQVHGTQDWAEGITHANYSGNGWVTYTIPIGQTFTGNINYMVFVGDDDGTRVNQNVEYRNPVLREETPVQLFLGKEVLSISPGSHDVDVDEYSVNAAGDTLNLTGNTWKAISYPYNVTANTVLEFQFRSTGQEAEINGIGFSSSLSVPATNRGWQVHGTQDWAEGITHANYSGNGWVTYTIPIGQTFTGNINYMVFVGDDDGTRVNQNVEYRNARLIH